MAKTVRVGRKRSSLKKLRGLIGKKSKVARKNRSRRRVKLMRGGDSSDVLLIIDPQNDFTDIDKTIKKKKYLKDNTPEENPNTFYLYETSDSKGLQVPGAKGDLDRLVELIKKKTFKEIHVSLDSHTKNHIGHIGFWTPESSSVIEGYDESKRPRPLEIFSVGPAGEDSDTVVDLPAGEDSDTVVDLYKKFPIMIGKNENKRPAYAKYPAWQKFAHTYIRMMQEKKTNDPTVPEPCLWSEHCIKGEDGWKVYDGLGTELANAVSKGSKVFYHEKGTNDFVEMYSIFSAEIPFDDVIEETKKLNPPLDILDLEGGSFDAALPEPSTELNKPNSKNNYATGFNETLFKTLMSNGNKVYVCGEAKSHCVKTSLQDMIKHCNTEMPASNIILIQDCTSIIGGFEDPTNAAFSKLQEDGMKMINSTDVA